MGAPLIGTAALNTRTGRRILTGTLIGTLVVVAFLLTPLIAIPYAITGAVASTTITGTNSAPVASGEWGYPLSGGYFKGRGYGHNPVQGCSYCSTNHKGYDMAQGCGTTIYAAGPGRVTLAGAHYGYGNAVLIDHGNDIVTLYGHMQWGSLRVSVGQQVTAGTPLGAEGNTGNSFGCHLHFEVRESGTPVPPEAFMADLGLPLK